MTSMNYTEIDELARKRRKVNYDLLSALDILETQVLAPGLYYSVTIHDSTIGKLVIGVNDPDEYTPYTNGNVLYIRFDINHLKGDKISVSLEYADSVRDFSNLIVNSMSAPNFKLVQTRLTGKKIFTLEGNYSLDYAIDMLLCDIVRAALQDESAFEIKSLNKEDLPPIEMQHEQISRS